MYACDRGHVSILCCCGPIHSLYGCTFGFVWKLRVQGLSDVTAPCCILLDEDVMSHASVMIDTLHIWHPPQTCWRDENGKNGGASKWKQTCRSASCFLVSQCFNKSLYSWTCSVLLCMCYMSLWVINEGEASLKLIIRWKQRVTNVWGPSAGSDSNTLICTIILIYSLYCIQITK